MTPTPTPAQLARAREIAISLTDEVLLVHRISSAIARALADEAQHTVKLETHQLAMKLGERAFRERDEARQQLADAEQRGRQAGLREALSIASEWAVSHSCDYHQDNPCCHVRTGAGIAARIRALAEEGPRR